MRRTLSKILFIGAFPPPTHGLSTVTKAVYDRLQAKGFSLVKVNTSPPTMKGGFYRLQRIPVMFNAWAQLVCFGWKQVLYIPLSGGWGQIYDIGSLLLARVFGMQRILHHHSTAYLVKKRLITFILFSIAGKDAVHIVLCDAMHRALFEKYKCQKIIQLSNLALFPMEEVQEATKQLQTIGFLSNITAEKGGWEVIELARTIQERHWSLKVIVAGPCLEPDLAQALQQANQEGVLQWLGPLYDDAKQGFWDNIDVFVFPTQYNNEAEPLVVWEALANGVPVIANDQGYIRWQVGLTGKIVSKERDFNMDALEILQIWMNNPAKFQSAVALANEQYYTMHYSAKAQWKTFLEILQ